MNSLRNTKKCSKCFKRKELSEFYPKINFCKTCDSIRKKEYRRSIRGLCLQIYSSQKSSSKKRGHDMPDYSKEDLFKWITSNAEFRELYYKWVESGYDARLTPSCDRLNDYKPYTLDNIRITTWRNNRDKYYSDAKKGINTKSSKRVGKYDMQGNKIAEYYSVSEASRAEGVNHFCISSVCKGLQKTSNGFKWKYEDDE